MKQFFLRTCSGNRETSEKGVALLFVILLTSVLLLVSIGITNISYRETTFSFEAQESDRAFFAADTGIECALYLDAPTRGVFSGSGIGSYTCGNPPISPYLVDTSPTFSFVLPLGPRSCALVNVNKAYDALGTGASDYTSISSVGYNVGASSDPTVCVSGTPGLRVVTRRLFLQYPNSGTSGTTGGGGSGGGTTTTPTTATLSITFDTTDGNASSTITSDGGSPVVTEGYDYSIIPTTTGVTQPFPGTYASHVDWGYASPVGTPFSTYAAPGFPVTSCSTVYVRSWVTNGVGTAYSTQASGNIACP
ncbi:MAG: hypothetical protein WCG55_03240 [bacterium]